MKIKMIFLLGWLLLPALMTAQNASFEGRVINGEEVPEVVRATQDESFEDKKVVRWRYQKSTGAKGNSYERYIATMKEKKRPLSNARYAPDGELIYYAEYYGARTIPALLKPDLEKNFPNHRPTGGTHIKLYRTKKEYYRIRLKKGSTVTYVFYNRNGNQIDRNQLPSDAEFN